MKISQPKRKRAKASSARSTEVRGRRVLSEARGRRATLTPPEGLSASLLAGDPDGVVVLSYPVAAVLLPRGLTDAEREVVLSILEGKSNAAIAEERGRSARTVANQVNSVFRKLGVVSRTELVALCTRAPSGQR